MGTLLALVPSLKKSTRSQAAIEASLLEAEVHHVA
jgi:hypothetical protein